MYPRLFELGPITVYTYGVLLAAAYLLGLKFAMVRAKARGLDAVRVLDLGIYIIISALVGAKLLLLITDFRSFRADPRELLTLARSGGVFYGGLILAVIVALWYIRRAGLPLWTTCDVFAPGIALGHVVGRFGCFFAGCCYGKPTTLPWGIIFTDPFAAANVGTPLGVHLHPTQLYEAGAEGLILLASAADGEEGQAVRRPDVLALHPALRRVALHHRILPRRRARHGRHLLDLAVHLARPRAAGDRDARLPRAREGAGAEGVAQAGGLSSASSRERAAAHVHGLRMTPTASAWICFSSRCCRPARARRFNG